MAFDRANKATKRMIYFIQKIDKDIDYKSSLIFIQFIIDNNLITVGRFLTFLFISDIRILVITN